MKTLILPVAGRSSRFPGMRPKWLLTMPDGKLMVEKSVEGLEMADYDRVVLVCLKEHIEKYLNPNALDAILSGLGHPNTDICVLEEPTTSQSETVASALKRANICDAFFVKDCDNMFNASWNGSNEIAVLDLNNVGLIDAKNKSYVSVDALGNITNIVEKQVIGNLFCCGGYGFGSSEEFLRHFKSIKSSNEIYLSHVIYSMLMSESSFRITKATGYTDWGTLREYRHYTRKFLTLFCDVDGVLLYNGSKFGKNGWATEPISENLHTISRMQKSGLLYLVITSSRPKSEVDYIQKRLEEFNIMPDQYVMGLPHTRRMLVNDYSATNPFPTAISINIERDSKQLSEIMESMVA
jgi:hypothetical protein